MSEPKKKRVGVYVRVSRGSQTVENQLKDLHEVAERSGWEIVEIYRDEAISGVHGKDKRPGFAALSRDINRKHVDLVAAWSLDRLGRSLKDLLTFLSELEAKGVDLFLYKQGLDTSTPVGRMMFSIIGSFAEYERELIRERVHSGLERAKAQGKILGRPKVSPETEIAILDARNQGKGIRKIADELKVGVGTVIRVIESTAKESA